MKILSRHSNNNPHYQEVPGSVGTHHAEAGVAATEDFAVDDMPRLVYLEGARLLQKLPGGQIQLLCALCEVPLFLGRCVPYGVSVYDEPLPRR